MISSRLGDSAMSEITGQGTLLCITLDLDTLCTMIWEREERTLCEHIAKLVTLRMKYQRNKSCTNAKQERVANIVDKRKLFVVTYR